VETSLLNRLVVLLAAVVACWVLPRNTLSAEAAKEKVTFGYAAISPSMAGVWMAKEMGVFDKHGLSVDLVYISSGAVVTQALVGGSVHAALGPRASS